MPSSPSPTAVAPVQPVRAIGTWLFKLRGYTPIPLVLAALIGAHPTWRSAIAGTACVLGGECVRLWGVSHAGSATRTREVGAPRQ